MRRLWESSQSPQPPPPRSPWGSVRTVEPKVARGCLMDRGSCRAPRCRALGHGKILVVSDLQSEPGPNQTLGGGDDLDAEPARCGQEVRRQSLQAIHGGWGVFVMRLEREELVTGRGYT